MYDLNSPWQSSGKQAPRRMAFTTSLPPPFLPSQLRLSDTQSLLTPPNHLMCSQSGNLHQDLAACSGHSPCILESDAEPNSSPKQETQLPDMGLQYMTIPDPNDVRYNSDSGTSHSPVYSIEPPSIHNFNTSSALNFLPHTTNIFPPSLTNSGYSSGGSSYSSSYFSPSPSVFSMPDIKPRLSSLNSSPGMAPPSRSPALPHLSTPRDIYTGATPHLRRTSDLLSRSPSFSGTLRGVPVSPSSSGGFQSPTNMENSLGGQGASPPLLPTEVIHQLQATDGQLIRPEIFGKIDKGFFMADNDWTCYRRNYFSLNCSYTLHPAIPTGNIHLVQNGGSSPQIHGFALSIAAVVDGRDGKAIELVQHTPKRDKGPQDKPSRVVLAPRPPPSLGMYGSDGSVGSRSLYDTGYGQNPSQPATEATFERIQFKNATANNGKRRAAQQYYHLLVELFVDVGPQHTERWVKIATRMSAPMVVRGRSPGHYQSERRGSNASTGPGGSGGAGGGGSYTPSGSTSRTPGEMGMPGAGNILPSSGYGTSYDARSHHYRSNIAPLQILMEPTLSAEEAKSIEEAPCYLYYPGAIYEGHEASARYQLPSVSEYTTTKIKQEYYPSGYVLPSLASTHDGLGRHCGRWEGTTESKGYFPTALIQQELNIS